METTTTHTATKRANLMCRCECGCGCDDLATGYSHDGTPVCDECYGRAQIGRHHEACERSTAGFRYCPVCQSRIHWDDETAGCCRGECDCGDVWRHYEDDGSWCRYEYRG